MILNGIGFRKLEANRRTVRSGGAKLSYVDHRCPQRVEAAAEFRGHNTELAPRFLP